MEFTLQGKWSGNSISTGGKSSSGTRAKENRSRPAQKPPVVIEQTPDIGLFPALLYLEIQSMLI